MKKVKNCESCQLWNKIYDHWDDMYVTVGKGCSLLGEDKKREEINKNNDCKYHKRRTIKSWIMDMWRWLCGN